MILLLENTTTRLAESEINFSHYDDIMKTVSTDERCNDLLDAFLHNHAVFDKYETIIIHESIYREEKRKYFFEELENYCKDRKLIKFSGNNTQALLTSISLDLSDKDLYTNLVAFLEEYRNHNYNILMLAYGKHWDLNKLLNVLQKLNLFIENYEDEKLDFDEFEDDFDLLEFKNLLNNNAYNVLLQNLDNFENEISLEQIKVLASNFQKLIQEKSK